MSTLSVKQILVLVYAVRRSEIVPWILWITSDPKLPTDLVLHKIWGAAACPPQAFSIRPLPGFSLGAVLRFFCLTRLSQSVLVCLKTSESLPGPLRIPPAFSVSAAIGYFSSSFLIPFLVPFLVPFLCQFWPQNGPQNGPKIGPKIDNFGVHFWIPFLLGFGALWVPLGSSLGPPKALLGGLWTPKTFIITI